MDLRDAMATVNEVVLRIELCEREALNTDKIDSFALVLNQAFVERSARWFLNLESAHEQTTRKPGRELAAVVIGIGQRLSGVGRGGGTEASRLRLRGCFT